MLCKLCHFVSVATIKLIYYAIFHSHLSYVCTAWVRIWTLNITYIYLQQKKAVIIISFGSFDTHTLPIFAELNKNKFADLISFSNCILSINIFWVSLPQLFHVFSFWHLIFMNKTLRSASHGLWINLAILHQNVAQMLLLLQLLMSWNFFQRKFSNNNLWQLSYSQLKVLNKNY